jgi:type IV secretory pathway VirB2 component (pilin)
MQSIIKNKKHIALVVCIALLAPLFVFAVKLPDPLNASAPLEIFARVVQGFLGIVGAFALLNFIIAGVGLIASRGNPEKVQKHKENLIWTIIGIILLFTAYAIVAFVIERLTTATLTPA